MSLFEAFRKVCMSRHSTKRFAVDRKIPCQVLNDVLKCTLAAPSGYNLQPWQVILVQNNEVKQKLSEKAMLGSNTYRVKDASAIAVFCADLQLRQRIERVVKLEKDYQNRDPGYLASLPLVATVLSGEGKTATFMKRFVSDIVSDTNISSMPNFESIDLWSYKNVSLAAQNYMLSATSHGLATCSMEGFDERRAKEVLRIPDRYGIPLMVATGYVHELDDASLPEKRAPRLSIEELVFDDEFGNSSKIGKSEHEENHEYSKG